MASIYHRFAAVAVSGTAVVGYILASDLKISQKFPFLKVHALSVLQEAPRQAHKLWDFNWDKYVAK